MNKYINKQTNANNLFTVYELTIKKQLSIHTPMSLLSHSPTQRSNVCGNGVTASWVRAKGTQNHWINTELYLMVITYDNYHLHSVTSRRFTKLILQYIQL